MTRGRVAMSHILSVLQNCTDLANPYFFVLYDIGIPLGEQ